MKGVISLCEVRYAVMLRDRCAIIVVMDRTRAVRTAVAVNRLGNSAGVVSVMLLLRRAHAVKKVFSVIDRALSKCNPAWRSQCHMHAPTICECCCM